MDIGYKIADGTFVVDQLHEGDVLVVATRRGCCWLRRPQFTGSSLVIDTMLLLRRPGELEPFRELTLRVNGKIENIVVDLKRQYGFDLTACGRLAWIRQVGRMGDVLTKRERYVATQVTS